MKQPQKTLLLWVVVILSILVVWTMLDPSSQHQTVVPYSEFMQLAKSPEPERRITEVEVRERDFLFVIENQEGREEKNLTVGPADADLSPLIESGIIVRYEQDEGSATWTMALTILIPMLLILGMFYLFMRQLQSGGGKAMSFGKSRARLLNEAQNKVTFADVAGIDEAKGEVEEIIAFLKNPKKFQRLGGRIPKGVLMMGPPGTGKTLLARAIAGEAGVPFFSISGSDFVEMFVGVGASRVRDLFEQGKKHAPCIIFIDEIDAVGRHRGAGMGGGHDEREQTLNQLLVEMDGFESNEGVILVAATNRPDVLDPAILRPGRFDRRITVPRPDIRGREGILGVHTVNVPLGPDVELAILAAGTPGFVGADLENLVNEAALLAARLDKDKVFMDDFEHAKDKVLMGTERRSMVMSQAEQRTTAWHEAGHTLIGEIVEGNDPVHKVSIIPRGSALGVTQMLPVEDRHTMTEKQALARIAMMLGGRIAEEVAFGDVTTGASDDIKRATRLARAMVCEYGMSTKLGPLAYGENEGSVFLGRDMTQRREDYSDDTAREIDKEVREIIESRYELVLKLMNENRDKLDRIAEALLVRETLDSKEIAACIAGVEMPERRPVVIPKASGSSDKKEEPDEKTRTPLFTGPPKPATGEA